MRRKGLILFVLIANICLAACQESDISPTVDVNSQPPSEEIAENPAPNENNDPQESARAIPEDIIEETGITVGASPTSPPPTPTFTPVPALDPTPTATPDENVNQGGGGSNDDAQTFTNVSVNSGGFDGAIWETQIVGGGGGDIGDSCVGNGEIIYLGNGSEMTTDELVAAGCVLVDGSPFVICCLTADAAVAQRPWQYSSEANLWNDNLTRIVIHNLDPLENAKILFYVKNWDQNIISLLGWQEIQVNSNGFLLLKTELPFSFDKFFSPGSGFDLVLQRENGVMKNDFGTYLDSDEDGLDDGDEVYSYFTDIKNPDTDGDGLLDGEEVRTHFTNPTLWDSDDDGSSDWDEIFTYNTDPNVPDSAEVVADSDGDGLTDEEEVAIYGTDPQNRDTDGDGRSDGDEASFGTNPNTTMNADDISYVVLEDGEEFYRDFNSATGWVYSDGGNDVLLQENRRGPWGIYLYDPVNDMIIHLDFWTKEVSCGEIVCGYVAWVSP